MVQGAPRRAAEAATRTAPERTNRSQLQRITSPSSKSHPTQTSGTKSSLSGGHSSSPGKGNQPPCKNGKSTKHTTKWCTSTKCYDPNCGKSFKDAVERKAHNDVREHGFYKSDDKQLPAGRKSSLKKGQSKPGVKFSKVNRVQSEDGGEEDDDSCIDSEVSSDSSMSVDRPPKSIVWKDRPKSRKVSKIRTVSTIHRTTRMEPPTEDTTSNTAPQPPRVQSRRNKRSPSHRSQYSPVPASRRSRLPWPHGSGLPGFERYTGKKWYKRQHQMLRESQFPLLAPPSDPERLSHAATLSSQNPSRMTSPLMTTRRSTVVPAR